VSINVNDLSPFINVRINEIKYNYPYTFNNFCVLLNKYLENYILFKFDYEL